jgi:hypothetical protein
VHGLLARMHADGVEVIERYNEPVYRAFKCTDLDGYQVKTYWEPTVSKQRRPMGHTRG